MHSSVIGTVMLPKTIVYDDNLTAVDIRLFVILLDIKSPDGTITESLDALAARAGISKFTVVDALRRLTEGGFITKERRHQLPSLLTIKSGEVIGG